VFITAVPIIKLFAWGEGDSGGHVLRETTRRGLCGLVFPSRTSERGGEGDCVKEGGGLGRRRGAREGACTGADTMPQPSTLRLILNAAALAVVSPTLLFSDWQNAARLKRNESDWLRCDDIPAAVKCASVSRWACRKRRRKNSVHACACADNGGEKRNVLIVSVLLPIADNFALRSKTQATQRRIEVLGMR
jgi:hypothetical protein